MITALLFSSVAAAVAYLVPLGWILRSKEGHATICVPISPRLFGLAAWGGVAGPLVAFVVASATAVVSFLLGFWGGRLGRFLAGLAACGITVGALRTLDYISQADERTADERGGLDRRVRSGDLDALSAPAPVPGAFVSCAAVADILRAPGGIDLAELDRIQDWATVNGRARCLGASDLFPDLVRRRIVIMGMGPTLERYEGHADWLATAWKVAPDSYAVEAMPEADRRALLAFVIRHGTGDGLSPRAARRLAVAAAFPVQGPRDLDDLIPAAGAWVAEHDRTAVAELLRRYGARPSPVDDSTDPNLPAMITLALAFSEAPLQLGLGDALSGLVARDGRVILDQVGIPGFLTVARRTTDWLTPLLGDDVLPVLAVADPAELSALAEATRSHGRPRTLQAKARATFTLLADSDPACPSFQSANTRRSDRETARTCLTMLSVLIHPGVSRCVQNDGQVHPEAKTRIEACRSWVRTLEDPAAEPTALAVSLWLGEHRPGVRVVRRTRVDAGEAEVK